MTNFATPVVADQISFCTYAEHIAPRMFGKIVSIFCFPWIHKACYVTLLLGLLPPFHLSILV